MTTINAIGIATGALNTVLLGQGVAVAPVFSTATYPATTTINQLLYSSSANIITGLATTNSGTLVTSATGVPSILALGATQTLVGVVSGTPAAGSIPGTNMVLNGDFQVWQRGAGGAATFAITGTATQYTADRWQTQAGAATNITVTQSAGATSGSFLCKVQRNAANAGTANIILSTTLTRDMCVGAAGNAITLSFKAKAGANFSAASSQLSVFVISGTGTNDVSQLSTGFTGAATLLGTTATLTTTLTNFTYNISALASTVTQLNIQLFYAGVGAAGADDSFSVTDIQLEISPVQTPFDRKSFFDTWTKCQRFYQKSFLYGTLPVQNAGINTGEIEDGVQSPGALTNVITLNNFPLMQTTPAVTTFSPAAATAQVYNITAAGVHTATTAVNSTNKSLSITSTGVIGGIAGQRMGVHITMDADLT